MSIWRIVFANLKHSWRQHMGTCLAASLTSMILIGALTVGDSVRTTLLYQAQEKIGLATHLFVSEEGYFHSDLAERIQKNFPSNSSAQFAPTLMAEGTFSSPDGKTRASGIHVLGIDDRFFEFARDHATQPDLNQPGYWLSPDLAEELKLQVGSRMVLRVEEPSLFSRDAPLSGERDARFVSWNRPYLGELKSSLLGKFSIRSNMDAVRTVFAPLSMLQQDMFAAFDPVGQRTDFANLLLVSTQESRTVLERTAEEAWSLSDAGLEIKKLRFEDDWSLRTRSVFLPDSIVDRASKIEPTAQGELTYLVNAIQKVTDDPTKSSTLIPYSMVAGVAPGGAGLLEPNWKDDAIALNQWAAEDLNASVGDRVKLEYFVVGERRRLNENSRSFTVAKILPLPPQIPLGKESDWTPRFPGLSEAENCGEWDTGIPIKHDIRPKDEAYWDEHRGSPKAFVSLGSAKEMWGNRWGNHTGLRLQGEESAHRLGRELVAGLTPSDSGVRLIELKKNAERASSGPVDFSQLFLSFGFFVILAGVSLSAMLFGFSMDQRNRQVGMFLALGYSRLRIRVMIWQEAAIVCLLGTVLGIGWSWFLGKGILSMLGGAWGGAVSHLSILYAPTAQSVILGGVSSFCIGLASLAWAGRKQLKHTPNALLSGAEWVETSDTERPLHWAQKIEWSGWLIALGLLLSFWSLELPPGPIFFATGSMILTAGMARFFQVQNRQNIFSNEEAILQRIQRKPGRKFIVVGMLATGAFLVIGAGAFHQKPVQDALLRESGTGGFSHLLSSSLPIYDDLLGEEARELFDLDPDILEGVSLVPLRALQGDDASCFNLNQSSSPPLYGVPLNSMQGRFNFVEGDWLSLKQKREPRVYPALIDQNTLMWSLKKKVGDRLSYLDEQGRAFDVEITAVVSGSFLQGGLYISENNWIKNFPGRGGYQHFWFSAHKEQQEYGVRHLKDRLFHYGLEAQATTQRLDKLKNVENTYLSIFQGLGGLGVILGTVGLLIVILRNLWECRAEQAILRAIGYSAQKLRGLAWHENIKWVNWGLIIGSGAGLLSVIPAAQSGMGKLSILEIAFFLLSLFVLAAVCVFWAIRWGLRESQLEELRHE